MKKFKIFYIALLVGVASLASSCEKYFEGVNDNPNQTTEVTPNLLLSSAQVYLAYGNGGDVARYVGLITQHFTGVSRQFATYQTYNISETELDNWWRFNMYGGGLNDLYILNRDAEANGWPQYAGVAKVLLAYGMMVVTDIVGDAPLSAAFQGADGLAPAYDSQNAIYDQIINMLTTAKTELNEATGPLFPGADDLIYGGDVAQWTKTANVLLARANLHLGKVNGNAAYTAALNALGNEGADSYGSVGDDAVYTYGTAATESGPWFQYIDQRDDIAYTGFIYDTMNVMGDPRYFVYLDTATGSLGNYFSRPDAPFRFASYVEQKFIEAEAAFQTGDLQRASDAHNAGVLASLGQFGVTDATFIANEASTTSGDITLEKIMLHKYIALFLDFEVFSDWRRTGFPNLQPNAGSILGGAIPRRLPYPQSERLFNGSNMPSVSITTPVWWDQ